MAKAGTKKFESLVSHQRTLQATLRDFRDGRGTSYLSMDEVNAVIGGLEARLTDVNTRLHSL